MDMMANERQYPCVIWGPTCDSTDCLVKEYLLPDMNVGEWIIFPNMGAYTIVNASSFNGIPKPKRYYRLATQEWLVSSQLPSTVMQICNVNNVNNDLWSAQVQKFLVCTSSVSFTVQTTMFSSDA